MVIDQSGSTSRSNAPRVALMIPAPMRTTSVFEVEVTLESDTVRLPFAFARLYRLPGYPAGMSPAQAAVGRRSPQLW